MITRQEWERAIYQSHGSEYYDRIKGATVAVCGLGGIGSNTAVSLIRAGIGRLILIDFDRVDVSNLNRQQYKASQVGQLKTDALKSNLLEICPFADVEVHCIKLDETNVPEILKDADIICEAFDKADQKAMLFDLVAEHFPEKYMVCASGMAGIGSANSIRTRKLTKRIWMCGDETSDVAKEGRLLAPRVMLCASHEAMAVIHILLEMEE